jgi:hydrogenase maturation protein HypF
MSQGDHIPRYTSRCLRLGGSVQGVGFRPFVSRSAQQFGITGSVCNHGGEVEIVAQGDASQLERFLHHLLTRPPPLAQPLLKADQPIELPRQESFTILPSRSDATASVHLPLDQPLCHECLQELGNPADRRYHYPFINCTQCGPRYTLIAQLPYDRSNTAMAHFALCEDCRREYHDQEDRRYHAEPIACPACGPALTFERGDEVTFGNEPALAAALAALRAGAIVAVKGIGGYHLMCDARNEDAVTRLRQRKQRPAKPLAVMFPWRGIKGTAALNGEVLVTPVEEPRLLSPERPIVICARHPDSTLAPSLAPGLPEIGVLLPYSPLHHLLLDQFDGPLVATSANLSGEPVLSDNDEARRRLDAIADAFLHHDRPILHPSDDSLYRSIANTTRPLRLGRGSAPRELTLPFSLPHALLAVGGHLKNSVTLAWDNHAVLSPHIGDLDTPRGLQLFEETLRQMQQLYGVEAEAVVCDAHPDYASSRWARQCGLPVDTVLHHHAHASALYGEHHGEGDWLVFTWDGSGYGGNHTLWGGETFLGTPGRWQHFATLSPFHLPGGEKAARQPWRSGLALCWEAGRDWPQASVDTSLLLHGWQRGVNAPASSAVGRLFDGAAALLGLCHDARYEGEAAMRLESNARPGHAHGALPLVMNEQAPLLIDWQPLLPLLFDEQIPVAQRAGAFHDTLADTILAVARLARERHDLHSVGLCGGVFQNRLLGELAAEKLQQHGFEVKLATGIPCNDGGIAFGQVIEYLYRQESHQR